MGALHGATTRAGSAASAVTEGAASLGPWRKTAGAVEWLAATTAQTPPKRRISKAAH
jgi:hypothetical protein